jgi:hypothetical protein
MLISLLKTNNGLTSVFVPGTVINYNGQGLLSAAGALL